MKEEENVYAKEDKTTLTLQTFYLNTPLLKPHSTFKNVICVLMKSSSTQENLTSMLFKLYVSICKELL